MDNINREIIYVDRIVYKLPDAYLRAQKKYREKNPEKMKEIYKRYYDNTLKSEEYLQHKRDYYQANKEIISEKKKLNQDKNRLYQQEYRLKKKLQQELLNSENKNL